MRIMLWLLLIAGIVCVGVLSFVGLSYGNSSSLFIAALLVWPLVGVAIVLIAAAILKAIWTPVKNAFGHDAVSRLLSGGIVAFTFSDTLQSVFSPLVTLLFDLFSQVPRNFATAWSSSNLFNYCAEKDAAAFNNACMQPLLNSLVFSGSDTLTRFGSRITGFDFALLVTACGFWALLGQLFSAAMQARDQHGARSRWADVMESFADRTSPSRANFLLFVIIACGATLSASALIAIPVISDSAPLAEKDLQQAQTEIDALLKDSDTLPQVSPVEGKLAAGIKGLRTEFDTAVATPSPNGANPQQMTAVLSQLERDADYLESEARRFWLAVRDSATRELGNLKDRAHDRIQRQNLAATNLRSKSGYLLDIKNWAASSVRDTMQQANMCRAWIEDVNGNFLRAARYELEAVRDYRGDASATHSLIDQFRTPAQLATTCTGFHNSRTPDVASLPSLGPFSFAMWLIVLSSMSLTLVTGMLGFGLLGAAISSVIRDRKSRRPNEPLVKDLSELLIRGMSATIVVYLAVKGGLAVFAGTTAPEPNAYVLLLTCFVASVFSDDVWIAAKQWLKGKLAAVQQDDDGDANAKEPKNPGAASNKAKDVTSDTPDIPKS